MSEYRTGARGKGNPLHYSDIGFQSSNQVGISNDGNKGVTWSTPVGAKGGQNPNGAVPNMTGNRSEKVPSGLKALNDMQKLRTGAGHTDGFKRRMSS